MKKVFIVMNGEFKDPKKMRFFGRYDKGGPVIEDDLRYAMKHEHGPMAEYVAQGMAQRTGEPWKAITGIEHDDGWVQIVFKDDEFERYTARIDEELIAARKLLKAIFEED